MVEDELADARRFGIPDAEGTALRTLGLVADKHRAPLIPLRAVSPAALAPATPAPTMVRDAAAGRADHPMTGP